MEWNCQRAGEEQNVESCNFQHSSSAVEFEELPDSWWRDDRGEPRSCRQSSPTVESEELSESLWRADGGDLRPWHESSRGELVVVQGRGTACSPVCPPSFQDVGHCSAELFSKGSGDLLQGQEGADVAVPCSQGVHIGTLPAPLKR